MSTSHQQLRLGLPRHPEPFISITSTRYSTSFVTDLSRLLHLSASWNIGFLTVAAETYIDACVTVVSRQVKVWLKIVGMDDMIPHGRGRLTIKETEPTQDQTCASSTSINLPAATGNGDTFDSTATANTARVKLAV